MTYRVEFCLMRKSIRDMFYPDTDQGRIDQHRKETQDLIDGGLLIDHGFVFSPNGLEITTWYEFKDKQSFDDINEKIGSGKTAFGEQLEDSNYLKWCEENNIEWEWKIIDDDA